MTSKSVVIFMHVRFHAFSGIIANTGKNPWVFPNEMTLLGLSCKTDQ
jgi:hypothetical protein